MACKWLLSLSGFSAWAADATDEQWLEILERKPMLKPFRDSPWVHYDVMDEIINGNFANGEYCSEIQDIGSSDERDQDTSTLCSPSEGRRPAMSKADIKRGKRGRSTDGESFNNRMVLAAENSVELASECLKISASVKDFLSLLVQAYAHSVGFELPKQD